MCFSFDNVACVQTCFLANCCGRYDLHISRSKVVDTIGALNFQISIHLNTITVGFILHIVVCIHSCFSIGVDIRSSSWLRISVTANVTYKTFKQVHIFSQEMIPSSPLNLFKFEHVCSSIDNVAYVQTCFLTNCCGNYD